MQLILDHIAAIMVTGAVILLVLTTQFQAQRSAAEQTIAYAARKSTLEMADMIEQEFALIGEGTDSTITNISTNASGETDSFTFWREDGGSDVEVEYRLTETDSVEIRDEYVQLYKLDRYEDGSPVGGGPSTIRTFRITLMDAEGDTATPETAVLVKVAIVMAYPYGKSDDAYLFQSHWGITLRPLNLG